MLKQSVRRKGIAVLGSRILLGFLNMSSKHHTMRNGICTPFDLINPRYTCWIKAQSTFQHLLMLC